MMSSKLHMSETYDRIEWEFVKGVLTAMGSPGQFVNLIMRCISSVSYQILINGQPSESFTPEKGLWQGDPISPYLFILCLDVLCGLLSKDVEERKIHGIKVAIKSPQISHLLFAYDSLLFARANLWRFSPSTRRLQGKWSTWISQRHLLVEMCLMRKNKWFVTWWELRQSHSRYLGVPVVFGRYKK